MKVITKEFLAKNGHSLHSCIKAAKAEGGSFLSKFSLEMSEAETASSVSAAMRCGKLYNHRYVERMVKDQPSSVNLAVGTLVHSGLEHYWNWWSERKEGVSRDDHFYKGLVDALKKSMSENDQDFWSDEKSNLWLSQVRAYLYGYYNAHSEVDEGLGYHNVRPEFSFLYISKQGALRTGKMDVMMLRGDDEVVCMEHKTTSNKSSQDYSSDYWKRLEFDPQILFYREALEAIYPEKNPVILYDVIIKTAKKPLKGRATRRKGESDESLESRRRDGDESLTDYADRVSSYYKSNPSERYVRKTILALKNEQDQLSREIDSTISLTRDSRFISIRNSSACQQYGGPCDYLDVCSGSRDLNDGFTKKSNKHVEV